MRRGTGAAESIVLVAAMQLEVRAILRGLGRVRRLKQSGPPAWEGFLGGRSAVCLRTGVGSENVVRALAGFSGRPKAVWSLGFAGSLDPEIDEGELVLAREIVWREAGVVKSYAVDRWWQELLRDAAERSGNRCHLGRVFSSRTALRSAEEKIRAGREFGAIAVEMEGRGVVAEAARRGVPAAMVRVVLDPVDLSLEGVPASLGSGAGRGIRAAAHPRRWLTLIRLAAAVRRTAPVLTSLLSRVRETDQWPEGYLPS